MSDGPLRCQPMRPEWKKVALCASNESFAASDVRDAFIEAVKKDWKKDISRAFVAAIRKILDRTALSSEFAIQFLEDLRQTIPGSVMAGTLLDCLICAVADGNSKQAVLRAAIIRTLANQSTRRARHVEEICLRESRSANIPNIRRRVNEAVHPTDFESLTDELLNPGSKTVARVKKHDSVDDGVKFC